MEQCALLAILAVAHACSNNIKQPQNREGLRWLVGASIGFTVFGAFGVLRLGCVGCLGQLTVFRVPLCSSGKV